MEVQMRGRILTAAGTLALILAVAALLTTPAAGQAPGRGTSPAKAGVLPGTPDGHPDRQGVYDTAGTPRLEGPANTRLVLSDDEASKLEGTAAQGRALGDAPIKGDRPAPPVGGDGSTGAAGGVG